MFRIAIILVITFCCPLPTPALDQARQSTGANAAKQKYGVTGKGVVVAILDRGIDWRHPDFLNSDGTTRIQWMLDMSGQNGCPGNPAAVEYTRAQINAALQGGPAIPERDAVGHGTLTAGIAAGNGSASSGLYTGMAPESDLIIVKMTSEGAPAHGAEAAESPFNGCLEEAFDWLDAKITVLNRPAVALINSGVQLWGPTDGTSAISRKIDTIFGRNRPGRIYVEASGDEGGLPTHAGGTYDGTAATAIGFSRSSGVSSQMAIWHTGSVPAQISVTIGGLTVGPVAPGGFAQSDDGTVQIFHYQPGSEFYPVTSTSGDRFADIVISGHSGQTGTIALRAQGTGTGKFDAYSDAAPVSIFTDHLVSGRITDYASTLSAIVTGAHGNNRLTYADLDGVTRNVPNEGGPGQLWVYSAGGPTRDGRIGVDITTPGQNIFAPIATNSYWATFRFNSPLGSNGYYVRQGATSGAAPITVGAIALMLQVNRNLTSDFAKALLHATAISDANTGVTPNNDWGYGKLSVSAAIDSMCAKVRSTDVSLVGVCKGANNHDDFRGIGRSDVLLYNPTDGAAYAGLSNGTGGFGYVYSGFTPQFNVLRSGDLNGDGRADLILYNSQTSLAYAGIGNGDGTFAFQSLFWSPGFDFVESGDFNGDGKTDFMLYRSNDGTMYSALSNGNGTFSYRYTLVSLGFTHLRVGDFNGDGKSDVFLYRSADGVAYLGTSNADGSFRFDAVTVGGGYDSVQNGDLNGDGVADLVFYNSNNGGALTGMRTQLGFTFAAQSWSPAFTAVRLIDVNGDGKSDLALYNKNTAIGYLGIGVGTGAFSFSSLFWGPGFDVIEPTDLNGDAKGDVALYNGKTGTAYTGLSNGTGFTYLYSYWGIGKLVGR